MDSNQIQETIIADYQLFDDEMERYEFLIDEGKKLETLPDAYRTDENIVQGCQSKVWVEGKLTDGKMYYWADSNTAITKGIIALLLKVVNHQTPADIATVDFYFIEKSGLKEHLSSQRSNGLLAMIKQIKSIAAKFAAQSLF